MTDQNNTLAVDLNEETRNIWDQNAEFWDNSMGEGNDFQRNGRRVAGPPSAGGSVSRNYHQEHMDPRARSTCNRPETDSRH